MNKNYFELVDGTIMPVDDMPTSEEMLKEKLRQDYIDTMLAAARESEESDNDV